MGCAVNGPGESKKADFGVAGGKNIGIIYKKGKLIKKVVVEANQQKDILIENILQEITRPAKKH